MNRKSGNSYPNIASTWRKGFQISLTLLFAFVLCVLIFSNPFHHEPVDLGAVTKTQLEEIKTILKDFKTVCGRFPTTSEGLEALFKKPSSLDCARYPREGFIEDRPSLRESASIDRWGQPYKYTSDGNSFRIESSHGVSAEGK